MWKAEAWALRSDAGRVRRGNEDSAVLLPAGDGFSSGAIVCDGMGGGAAGEVASRLATERIGAVLAASSGPLAERLRSGIADANRIIREHSRTELDGAESGSTMVLALIGDGRATIAHIGDSRAYVLRSGRLQQLTDDHTFVAEQVRAGVIPAERAASHPLRSRLTKVLGAAERAEAEIKDHELRPGDVLLLCSDGLHGMVPDDDIAAALGPDVEGSASALIALANARGGKDNVTVALCRIGDGSAQFTA